MTSFLMMMMMMMMMMIRAAVDSVAMVTVTEKRYFPSDVVSDDKYGIC